MQLSLRIQKLLLVVVLSFALLVTQDSGNYQELPTGWNSISNPSPTFNIANTDFAENSADDSVWNSMRQQLKLDHRPQSAQVQAQIRKLLADQTELYKILTDASPYIYFIFEQTQAFGLPAELALIPVIESQFNPNDHSKKGAVGLWQLMPKTAHELGITIHSGYDGRRDVIASTKAALLYFNDLGIYFNNNWYLAIAAYDAGQVTIKSAERRAGSQSFWNLHLPKETKIYVPKLLAVAEIIKNPEKYGVQLPPISNTPYFTQLQIKKSVNLNKVAKKSGINIKTLDNLNPDYNHGIIAKKGTYTLLVPVNKADFAKAKLN